MDSEIDRALQHDRLIDITTIGRKSGRDHRIEISFFYDGDAMYLTGMPPRPRDWFANLRANPKKLTLHFKQSLSRGVTAVAEAILDTSQRRAIFKTILAKWKRLGDLEDWVAHSPLARIRIAPDERNE